jgi:toxin CptA
MARDRGSPPLLLRPRPSRLLAGLVALSHGLAAVVALALPLGWPGRLALVLLTVLGAVWNALTHVWPRTPWSVREALLGDDGWAITLGTGDRRPAQLAPSTFVGTSLIVLNFRCRHWPRWTLILLSDSVDPETRRRLRVRLRLGQGSGGA